MELELYGNEDGEDTDISFNVFGFGWKSFNKVS